MYLGGSWKLLDGGKTSVISIVYEFETCFLLLHNSHIQSYSSDIKVIKHLHSNRRKASVFHFYQLHCQKLHVVYSYHKSKNKNIMRRTFLICFIDLSFSDPYFLAFGLNTEIYRANLRIQSESGKIWTRKTQNRVTF